MGAAKDQKATLPKKIGQLFQNFFSGRGLHTEQYFINKIKIEYPESYSVGNFKCGSNVLKEIFSDPARLEEFHARVQNPDVKLLFINKEDKAFESEFNKNIKSKNSDEIEDYFTTTTVKIDDSLMWRLNYLMNNLIEDQRHALIRGLLKNPDGEKLEMPLLFQIMLLRTPTPNLEALAITLIENSRDSMALMTNLEKCLNN